MRGARALSTGAVKSSVRCAGLRKQYTRVCNYFFAPNDASLDRSSMYM